MIYIQTYKTFLFFHLLLPLIPDSANQVSSSLWMITTYKINTDTLFLY